MEGISGFGDAVSAGTPKSCYSEFSVAIGVKPTRPMRASFVGGLGLRRFRLCGDVDLSSMISSRADIYIELI